MSQHSLLLLLPSTNSITDRDDAASAAADDDDGRNLDSGFKDGRTEALAGGWAALAWGRVPCCIVLESWLGYT